MAREDVLLHGRPWYYSKTSNQRDRADFQKLAPGSPGRTEPQNRAYAVELLQKMATRELPYQDSELQQVYAHVNAAEDEQQKSVALAASLKLVREGDEATCKIFRDAIVRIEQLQPAASAGSAFDAWVKNNLKKLLQERRAILYKLDAATLRLLALRDGEIAALIFASGMKYDVIKKITTNADLGILAKYVLERKLSLDCFLNVICSNLGGGIFSSFLEKLKSAASLSPEDPQLMDCVIKVLRQCFYPDAASANVVLELYLAHNFQAFASLVWIDGPHAAQLIRFARKPAEFVQSLIDTEISNEKERLSKLGPMPALGSLDRAYHANYDVSTILQKNIGHIVATGGFSAAERKALLKVKVLAYDEKSNVWQKKSLLEVLRDNFMSLVMSLRVDMAEQEKQPVIDALWEQFKDDGLRSSLQLNAKQLDDLFGHVGVCKQSRPNFELVAALDSKLRKELAKCEVESDDRRNNYLYAVARVKIDRYWSQVKRGDFSGIQEGGSIDPSVMTVIACDPKLWREFQKIPRKRWYEFFSPRTAQGRANAFNAATSGNEIYRERLSNSSLKDNPNFVQVVRALATVESVKARFVCFGLIASQFPVIGAAGAGGAGSSPAAAVRSDARGRPVVEIVSPPPAVGATGASGPAAAGASGAEKRSVPGAMAPPPPPLEVRADSVPAGMVCTPVAGLRGAGAHVESVVSTPAGVNPVPVAFMSPVVGTTGRILGTLGTFGTFGTPTTPSIASSYVDDIKEFLAERNWSESTWQTWLLAYGKGPNFWRDLVKPRDGGISALGEIFSRDAGSENYISPQTFVQKVFSSIMSSQIRAGQKSYQCVASILACCDDATFDPLLKAYSADSAEGYHLEFWKYVLQEELASGVSRQFLRDKMTPERFGAIVFKDKSPAFVAALTGKTVCTDETFRKAMLAADVNAKDAADLARLTLDNLNEFKDKDVSFWVKAVQGGVLRMLFTTNADSPVKGKYGTIVEANEVQRRAQVFVNAVCAGKNNDFMTEFFQAVCTHERTISTELLRAYSMSSEDNGHQAYWKYALGTKDAPLSGFVSSAQLLQEMFIGKTEVFLKFVLQSREDLKQEIIEYYKNRPASEYRKFLCSAVGIDYGTIKIGQDVDSVSVPDRMPSDTGDFNFAVI